MSGALVNVIDGVWALRIIRGVVLPCVAGGLYWIGSELISMRDGFREIRRDVAAIQISVEKITAQAEAATREASAYRTQSAATDAATDARLKSVEESLRQLRDQVASIWRRSQIESADKPG